ncbi:hypothetical protein [Ciceribacter sp. L1K22]|uniref:hypothetical protein n=1 Tax=Ciceribacter sp. L1K22 TaxID=2820275 RepID=UPI001ABDEBAF|nr:hypothetical protein [Ciceribacter sp. L1K22]MBO3758470.1 hypothetical protein [Ciceribacter sp. L1K22]
MAIILPFKATDQDHQETESSQSAAVQTSYQQRLKHAQAVESALSAIRESLRQDDSQAGTLGKVE